MFVYVDIEWCTKCVNGWMLLMLMCVYELMRWWNNSSCDNSQFAFAANMTVAICTRSFDTMCMCRVYTLVLRNYDRVAHNAHTLYWLLFARLFLVSFIFIWRFGGTGWIIAKGFAKWVCVCVCRFLQKRPVEGPICYVFWLMLTELVRAVHKSERCTFNDASIQFDLYV